MSIRCYLSSSTRTLRISQSPAWLSVLNWHSRHIEVCEPFLSPIPFAYGLAAMSSSPASMLLSLCPSLGDARSISMSSLSQWLF